MKSLREFVQQVLITADKRRLPRIPMTTKYTTGDDQEWTYEYTWEDFNAAINMWPTAIIGSPESNLKSSIIRYFKDHPELLAKNNISKEELNTLLRRIHNYLHKISPK